MPPAHLALVENLSTEETHHSDTDTGFSQKLPDVVRTMGLLDGDQIENLKNQARGFRLPFEDLLDHSSDLSAESLTLAKSRAANLDIVDLAHEHIDVRLLDEFGANFCLKYCILPLRKIGGAVLIAVADPN